MIGVFDSGVGGLSVLREVVKALPQEEYIYYCDNAYCPYGHRSAAEIIDRARWITSFLLSKGCELIVVACNTATAAAIATLRAEWPSVPFVGIEPAIKPAAAATRSGVIGVLATHGTLSGEKYHIALGQLPSGVRVVEHVGEGFVELVESGIFSGGASGGASCTGEVTGASCASEVYRIIAASVRPLLEAGADTIVLGCTHYPFLIDYIRKVAESFDGVSCTGVAGVSEGVSCTDRKPITIIDPSPAVAAQVVRLWKERHADATTHSRHWEEEAARIFRHSDAERQRSEESCATDIKITPYASGDDTVLKNLIKEIWSESL